MINNILGFLRLWGFLGNFLFYFSPVLFLIFLFFKKKKIRADTFLSFLTVLITGIIMGVGAEFYILSGVNSFQPINNLQNLPIIYLLPEIILDILTIFIIVIVIIYLIKYGKEGEEK